MIEELAPNHADEYRKYVEFVSVHVEPVAGNWEIEQQISKETIEKIGSAGYLGLIIPRAYGGMGEDFISFGLLNEAFGKGSASLTVLFTVQNMVASSLLRWGTEKQLQKWIVPMAKGKLLAAFAITEPNVGSDISGTETVYSYVDDHLVLNGVKRWITFAEIADIYLVFGKVESRDIACIVEKNMPGVSITPIKNMLGFRACHLAQLEFTDVVIPRDNIIGKEGFAITHVASVGLHCGRISTAFSSLGLIRACLEACISRASSRSIQGGKLINMNTVQHTIAELGSNYEASMLLCLHAANAASAESPSAFDKAILAKLHASQNAAKAAADTVQLLGAFGCHEDSSPAGRFYRDSKIMEIIEGTTQVLKSVLGPYYIKKYHPLNPQLV